MKYIVTIALIASAIAMVLTGCGGGGGSSSKASLSGTIIDGASLLPLSGVRVALGSASTLTGADGRFNLTGLMVGSGVLTAQRADYEIASVTVTLVSGANQLSSAVQMVQSSGQPPDETPRTVQGTITLSSGATPAGVTVGLYQGTTKYDEMTTSADGKFQFWAPIGTYSVRAWKSGFSPQEQSVTVSDLTQVIAVDLLLSP